MSLLPDQLRRDPDQEVVVDCPPWLCGDESAFAFYYPDDHIAPLIRRGTLFFATRRRDPVKDDTIVLFMKDGTLAVRFFHSVEEDGVHVLRLPPTQGGAFATDVIPFGLIDEVAIIAGSKLI